MKIKAVRYDNDRKPSEFDVTLTLDQMGVIYALTGHMSPDALEELVGSDEFTQAFFDLNEIASEMNRHFDNGTGEIMPHGLAQVIRKLSHQVTNEKEGRSPVTDEMVENFKAVWNEADRQGKKGDRVRPALEAVFRMYRR